MERWYQPRDMIPNDNQKVLTMDSAGYVYEGVYHKGLWYNKDMTMYSYSTPVFWKPLED